ncbi:MAG: type II toxin-antitoxin system VapC family toxin, partial [Candidatus Bathyarchaeia archaeon]
KTLFSENIMKIHEDELIEKALEISVNHGITIYDSLYLALAINKGANLCSLDEKQIKIAKKLNIPVIPI